MRQQDGLVTTWLLKWVPEDLLQSLQKAATSIGIRDIAMKKLVMEAGQEAGQEALHCSKWI